MFKIDKTYQVIADILSFSATTKTLRLTLSKSSMDWDALVVEGSKHLMLPAIYCRLKAKMLLDTLPEELKTYLEEISCLNRNRNNAILNQVKELSELFKINGIDHVFLKGAALLASGHYMDNAERMVGDIDVLMAPKQIAAAFNLLQSNGYDKTVGYAYKTIGFRHTDRLISETNLAAIELHVSLFNRPHHNLLISEHILKSKVETNSVYIPTDTFLNLHNALGWQINDLGYYFNAISLKSFYDALILNLNHSSTALSFLLRNKYGRAYLKLLKHYFNDFDHIETTNGQMGLWWHKLSYTYASFGLVNRKVKMLNLFCYSRIKLVLHNKFYRQHILKKIFLLHNS